MPTVLERPDFLRPYLDASARIRALTRAVSRSPERGIPAPAPRLQPPGRQEDQAERDTYRSRVEQAELTHERPGVSGYPPVPPHRAKAVWRRAVGPAPSCGPGDREQAREYLERLQEAADRHAMSETLDDGTAPLTRNESRYLRRQIRKWQARAEGKDPRFEQAGTKAGRGTRGTR